MSDDDAASMYVTAALVEHSGQLLPVLVAEPGFDLLVIAASRWDMPNPLITVLLKQGMTWAGRMLRAPAAIPGWLATVNVIAGRLDIVAGDGTIVYVGTVDLPPQWRDHVERYGWAVLYLHTTPTRVRQASRADLADLRAAADKGQLLGGRVEVSWWPA